MNEGEIRVGDNTFLIDISPLSDKYLSSNSLQSLNREVDLYSITLERVKGNQPVSPADCLCWHMSLRLFYGIIPIQYCAIIVIFSIQFPLFGKRERR